MSRELSAGNGHGQPDKAAAEVGEEKERATSNSVNHGCSHHGKQELLAVVDESDVGLGNLTAVAGNIKHGSEKVRQDSIASPLPENGNAAIRVQTISGVLIREESPVVPPALVGSVHL